VREDFNKHIYTYYMSACNTTSTRLRVIYEHKKQCYISIGRTITSQRTDIIILYFSADGFLDVLYYYIL